ncbi:hypothetical protein ACPV5G_19935 [Photobacterium damselae]|uniref:hypothetical protein n=1 Tax=Photobacterium damselae TaxID=38293 RepID=UPI004069069E
MKRTLININNLDLDLDNPRFESSIDNQIDAINHMISIQGNKIYELAKDISKDGLDPSDGIIVYSDEDNNFTVVEGNRRISAIKILHTPSLITDLSFRKKIKSLPQHKLKNLIEIEVLIYNDLSYKKWIELKHTTGHKGVGRESWSPKEVATYNARNGDSSYSHQLITFIQNDPSYYSKIIANKKNWRLTNITRILSDPYCRQQLGLIPENNILFCNQSTEVFKKNILTLLLVMTETKKNGKQIFTVNRIRTKEDRRIFINELGIHEDYTNLVPRWNINDNNIEHPTLVIKNFEKIIKEKSINSKVESNDHKVFAYNEKIEKTDKSLIKNKEQQNKLTLKLERKNLVPSYFKIHTDDDYIDSVFYELKTADNIDNSYYANMLLFDLFIKLTIKKIACEDNREISIIIEEMLDSLELEEYKIKEIKDEILSNISYNKLDFLDKNKLKLLYSWDCWEELLKIIYS